MAEPTVLLFGGSFDPPHLAHTELAAAAAAMLGCGRILFIPAARNPLKLDRPTVSDADRVAMLERAIVDVPGAEVCAEELQRGGASFFVQTLESLRASVGGKSELRFLIGVDQALHFHRWKDWERILELATPAVMLRPPWDADSYRIALLDRYESDEAARWESWTLDLPLMDVSATAIRRRLASGESLDGLLAPAVEAYVREHGLYGASPDATPVSP